MGGYTDESVMRGMEGWECEMGVMIGGSWTGVLRSVRRVYSQRGLSSH